MMHFFDVSTSTDFIVEDAVLRELQDRADRCEVQLLVVGARARDLLIQGVLGSEAKRITADIDVAVSVQSWDDLTRLTKGLSHVGRNIHKFRVFDVEVDIIPFHGIETPSRTIVWPDEHVMQVLGFEEALMTSVTVRLPNVDVRVASLSAQVILKVVAWHERNLQMNDSRDAIDLRTIITAYSDGPYLDELFENHGDLLEAYDFDVRLAGADRLGAEALAMLADEGASQIVTLLGDACSSTGRLPPQMGGPISQNRALLMALLSGMQRNQEMRQGAA